MHRIFYLEEDCPTNLGEGPYNNIILILTEIILQIQSQSIQ
jgi:hypothetical protein